MGGGCPVSYFLNTNICISIINARPPHVLERFRQVSLGDVDIKLG